MLVQYGYDIKVTVSSLDQFLEMLTCTNSVNQRASCEIYPNQWYVERLFICEPRLPIGVTFKFFDHRDALYFRLRW